MSDVFNQNSIASQFWMHFNIGDNRLYYALSGDFVVNQKGQDQNWLRKDIHLQVPIVTLPEGDADNGTFTAHAGNGKSLVLAKALN